MTPQHPNDPSSLPIAPLDSSMPSTRSVSPRWLAILGSLAPQILQFTPLAPLAIPIANALDHAEHHGQSGEDKQRLVLETIVKAAEQYNEDSGSQVIDLLQLEATLIQLVTGIVAIVNLVHAVEAAPHHAAPPVPAA